ncbi:hypothetical protein BGZ80_003692 [Entomortierella chlamydospora]|uniref:Fe2OG dioxygenase domain-containing protein n=1 Tax=Entomortierella chlamydospora TaxID=101097 RepID=A0A9P6SWS5_9FUNG|nr:hypothetical protein BGZ79_008181 [Entomortierella chlamydospora]KAG0008212.1 hypothetical protein BGZ80_003692 [Entomortierella chlamydospora]
MAYSQNQPQSPLHSILEPRLTARLVQSPAVPTHLDLKPLLSLHRQQEEIVAFTLQNILSPQECQSLIERSEATGYEIALINSPNGQGVHIPGYRDGHRCIIDDHAVSAELWKRIKHHVPAVYKSRPVIGLNERLRFLKYGPGDKFQPHMDGEYRRTDGSGHVTKITVQFYLNQDCQGGATSFLQQQSLWADENEATRKVVAVPPKTGQALVFQHNLVHEGSKVTEGVKYVIRSDILYGPHL